MEYISWNRYNKREQTNGFPWKMQIPCLTVATCICLLSAWNTQVDRRASVVLTSVRYLHSTIANYWTQLAPMKGKLRSFSHERRFERQKKCKSRNCHVCALSCAHRQRALMVILSLGKLPPMTTSEASRWFSLDFFLLLFRYYSILSYVTRGNKEWNIGQFLFPSKKQAVT